MTSDYPSLPGSTGDLSHLTERQVLALWLQSMDELKTRKVLRGNNTPTGDYAEWIVSSALGLHLENNSRAGYDAVTPYGTRIQIKARRLPSPRTPRHLSFIRNLTNLPPDDPADEPFDTLIVVLFGVAFDVLECWEVPVAVVREYAVFVAHVNGHRLRIGGPILGDPRVIRRTDIEDWAQSRQ